MEIPPVLLRGWLEKQQKQYLSDKSIWTTGASFCLCPRTSCLLCLWRHGFCCSFSHTCGHYKSLSLSLWWILQDTQALNITEINQNVQKIGKKRCTLSMVTNLVPSKTWLKLFPFERITKYNAQRGTCILNSTLRSLVLSVGCGLDCESCLGSVHNRLLQQTVSKPYAIKGLNASFPLRSAYGAWQDVTPAATAACALPPKRSCSFSDFSSVAPIFPP